MIFCDCPIITVLIFTAITLFVVKKIKKFVKAPGIRPKPKVHKEDYKKGTVYLYQFKRLRNCPNISPFCLKIESLCRIYNIPYETVEGSKLRSRNGTLPFIELDGEHIADSDLIEIKLKQRFNIKALSTEQNALSVALSKLADNHLFYVLIRYKAMVDSFYWMVLDMLDLPKFLNPVLFPIIKKVLGRKIYYRSVAGIGNFESQELDEILHRDLKVFEDSIKGKFMLGDELGGVDAALFGQIASVYYPSRTYLNDVLEKDFPKLLEYIERVKKELYPNDFTV